MTAATTLVLGANTVIEQAQCSVAFSTSDSLNFGQQLGLLWLPLDESRKAACSPAYLHEPKDWAKLDNADEPKAWQLDLQQLFNTQGIHYLQLIVYAYRLKRTYHLRLTFHTILSVNKPSHRVGLSTSNLIGSDGVGF